MELDDFDLAELRKRNLADNQRILQQIKADLKKLIPATAKPKVKRLQNKSPKKVQARRESGSQRYLRARFSPPRTRSRRNSVSSSTAGSSAPTSPQPMVVKFGFSSQRDDGSDASFDDEEVIERRKPSRPRVFKPVDRRPIEEITEDDINMVAVYVSDKKYDSIHGSTCHQCRQKTDDMKTICRSEECYGVRGQFCGPCLRNRYGEDAKEALRNPDWVCPPCRKICNCSFCRKRNGKSCTGILIHLAKESGFSNVNDYLQSLSGASILEDEEEDSS